jgi:hypothetical protein
MDSGMIGAPLNWEAQPWSPGWEGVSQRSAGSAETLVSREKLMRVSSAERSAFC